MILYKNFNMSLEHIFNNNKLNYPFIIVKKTNIKLC